MVSISSHLEGVKPLVAAGTIVAGGTFLLVFTITTIIPVTDVSALQDPIPCSWETHLSHPKPSKLA